MSHRSRDAKRIRRLEKALRRTPNTYIDLVTWLKDRRHAQTTGEALKILEAGRVRNGSHVVGRVEWKEGSFVPVRLVPANYRKEMIVLGE